MNILKIDRHKTEFVCQAGTFQYVRMPLGLSNVPATIQRALDNKMTKYIWKTCVIYSKNVSEHIHHVYEIISTLSAAGVTLNVKR